MSGAFIELYFDEDVDVLIAKLLRHQGYVVRTTQEAGNVGISDEDQLRFASERAKVLLTHNRVDFETLARNYFNSELPHPGLIIAARRPPHEIVKRLVAILKTTSGDQMVNQVIYI